MRSDNKNQNISSKTEVNFIKVYMFEILHLKVKNKIIEKVAKYLGCVPHFQWKLMYTTCKLVTFIFKTRIFKKLCDWVSALINVQFTLFFFNVFNVFLIVLSTQNKKFYSKIQKPLLVRAH